MARGQRLHSHTVSKVTKSCTAPHPFHPEQVPTCHILAFEFISLDAVSHAQTQDFVIKLKSCAQAVPKKYQSCTQVKF